MRTFEIQTEHGNYDVVAASLRSDSETGCARFYDEDGNESDFFTWVHSVMEIVDEDL